MSITAQELAEKLGAELHGDPGAVIRRIGNLVTAGKDELSFLSDSKYREDLSKTGAGAVIIRKDDLEHCKTTALVMNDPYVGSRNGGGYHLRKKDEIDGTTRND